MSRGFNVSQRAPVAGVAGKRIEVKLDAARDSRYLVVTARAKVDISVANATDVRNLGSVFAIFPKIGFDEGGSETGVGRGLAFMGASEYLRGASGTATRLASPNVATTDLVEQIIIPFERLQQVAGYETRYRVREPGLVFSLFLDVDKTPEDRLVTKGGATVVVSDIEVSVQQHFTESGDKLPQLAPRWSEQRLIIAGAGANQEQLIQLSRDYLRGITILPGTVDGGLATDVINGFQLRKDGNAGIIIGENGPVDYKEFARAIEFESGGNVFGSAGGSMMHLDFQSGGRLSKLVDPFGENLRALWDAQPSGGGAGATEIYLLLHRLSRDEKVYEGGRRVVDPEFTIPV